MYIKEISGLKMMKNMRCFEPNHILVSVIKSKNIFAVSICDETCTVWNTFLNSARTKAEIWSEKHQKRAVLLLSISLPNF